MDLSLSLSKILILVSFFFSISRVARFRSSFFGEGEGEGGWFRSPDCWFNFEDLNLKEERHG